MAIPRSVREEAGIDRQNKGRKQALQELAQVVAELRQEAKEKGLDKMPKEEIDAAVASARRDLKKSSSQRR